MVTCKEIQSNLAQEQSGEEIISATMRRVIQDSCAVTCGLPLCQHLLDMR